MKRLISVLIMSCCALALLGLSACGYINVTDPVPGNTEMGANYIIVSDRPGDAKYNLITNGHALENAAYNDVWQSESVSQNKTNPSLIQTKIIPLTYSSQSSDYIFTNHSVWVYPGDNTLTFRNFNISDHGIRSSSSFNVFRQWAQIMNNRVLTDQDVFTSTACVFLATGNTLQDAGGNAWNLEPDNAANCPPARMGSMFYSLDVPMPQPGIYKVVAKDQSADGLYFEGSYEKNYVQFDHITNGQTIAARLINGQFCLPAEQLSGEIGYYSDGETPSQLITLTTSDGTYDASLSSDRKFEPSDECIHVAEGVQTISATLHDQNYWGGGNLGITEDVTVDIVYPSVEIIEPVDGGWVEYNGSYQTIGVWGVMRNLGEDISNITVNGEQATYSTEGLTFWAVVPMNRYGYFKIEVVLYTKDGSALTDSVTIRYFPDVDMVFDPQLEICDPLDTSSTCLQNMLTEQTSGTKEFTTRVLEGRPSLTYILGIPMYLYLHQPIIRNETRDDLVDCGPPESIDPSNPATSDTCRAVKFYWNIKNSGVNLVLNQDVTWPDLSEGNEIYRRNLLIIGNYLELGFVGAFPGTCDPEVIGCAVNWIQAVENAKDYSDELPGFKPFVGVVSHDEGLWSAYSWLAQYWYRQLKLIDPAIVVFGVWDTGVNPGANKTITECLNNYRTCPTEDVTYPMIYIVGGGPDSNSLVGLKAQFKSWTDYKNPETGKSVNFMILHGTVAGLESYDSINAAGNPVCYSPIPRRRMPMEGTLEMADAMAKSGGAIGTAFWMWGDNYYYRDYIVPPYNTPAGTWAGFWYGWSISPPCDPNDQGLFGLYDTKRWFETPPDSRPEHYGMTAFNLYEDALYMLGYTADELKQPGYGISTRIDVTEHYLSAAAMDKTDRDFRGIGIFKSRQEIYPDPDMDGIGTNGKNYKWATLFYSNENGYQWHSVNELPSNCYAEFKADYVPRDIPSSGKMLQLSLTFNKYQDPRSSDPNVKVSGIDLTARYQEAFDRINHPSTVLNLYQNAINSCPDDTCKAHIGTCYDTYYGEFPDLSNQCVIPNVTLTTEEQGIFAGITTGVENWLLLNFPQECVGREGTPSEFVAKKVIKQWPLMRNWPYIWLFDDSSYWLLPEGVYMLNAETRADSFQGLNMGTQWNWDLYDPLFAHLSITPKSVWNSGTALIYTKNEALPILYIYFPYWAEIPLGDTGRLNGWRQIQNSAGDGKIKVSIDIDNLQFWKVNVGPAWDPIAEVLPHEYATPEGAAKPPHKYYFDPFRYFPGEIPTEHVGQPSGSIKYDISRMTTNEFTLTGWYIPEISSKTSGRFVFAELHANDANGLDMRLSAEFFNMAPCNPGLYDEQCPTVAWSAAGFSLEAGPGGVAGLPLAFAAGQPVFWAMSKSGSNLLIVSGAYGSKLYHANYLINTPEAPPDQFYIHFPAVNLTHLIIGNTEEGNYPQEGYSSMVKGFNKAFTYEEIVEQFYKCGGKFSGCSFEAP